MDSYTIDQAATRMGMSKHTLRYYEREGLLEEVPRATSGHRRYTEADLDRVTVLRLLRGTGMPIREMKVFVDLVRTGDATIPERMGVLEGYRESLLTRMEDDKERLAFLDRKIGVYAGKLHGEVPQA